MKLRRRKHQPHDTGFDAQIDPELDGQKLLLLVENKNLDRRTAFAKIKTQSEVAMKGRPPGYFLLLVTPYVAEAIAEECRHLSLQPLAQA